MKKLFFLLASFLFAAQLVPQQFTEQTTLTGVSNSSVAWGDYDNDGDLDILLTGSTGSGPVSKIYRNDAGTFIEQTSQLLSVEEGSVAWGDYDNDGDLDILLTGYTGSSRVSKIYRNDGGTFIEQTSLIGVSESSVAWGDYDNDGDLDILLTGYTGSSQVSKIYRNNGGTFIEHTSQLLPVEEGSVAWGDYDNDGDLDILLTGERVNNPGSGPYSFIYRNNGNNTFSRQDQISLTGVYRSSVAWGDYDSDGDLDILLTGESVTGQVSKIYSNNGNNTFTEPTGISLTGVNVGSAAWGDYDNDGELDILLTGLSGSGTVSKIYRNNGDTTFTEQIGMSLTGVYNSSVAWGDYDNDGDLDIMLTGSYTSKIYRNNNITPNTLPAAPSNLTSVVNEWDVTLSWDKSTDNETPQNGLRYNLVIGTTPEAVNTLSPMSDRNAGYRRVINLGNTNHRNSWTIKGLEYGTYYWSVQAIDNAFAGSNFGEEQNFILIDQFTEQSGILLTGVYFSTVAWGDYDNDDDLDILLTGQTGSGRVSKIYRNNGDSTFSEQTAISLIGVDWSSVAWGDYDNDDDLDILLTGQSGSGPVSKIYRNDRNNTFTEQTTLTGVSNGSVAWGDYDNDGDLDILLTGNINSPRVSKIYRNNGDSTFTEQTSILLQGVEASSVAWGDYDNDGDLDILLTGNTDTGTNSPVSKIYRNNGDSTFTEQTEIYLQPVCYSSVAWGDYDNDGDLDILLTGESWSGRESKIYRNDVGTFTQQTTLARVRNSSVAWGDYDNDGDLDILLTGYTLDVFVSKIYRNNGDNTFTEQTSISLTAVVYSSVAWGDYDNDGDLDILLTGYAGSVPVSKIYRNNNIIPNTMPAAPSNLQSAVSGQDVTLSWDKSTDNETPQDGLRYNLVIGTSPNAVNTLSPISDRNTGYRRIINLGNTNHNNSWTIKDLDSAQTYYWSVQATDNAFAGSNFALEKTFYAGTTTFQLTVSVNDGWNMVSIPGLHPVDQNVNTWWPLRDFATNVFGYNNGYYIVNTATPTEGYWMKHPGARTYNTGDEWPASGIIKVPHDTLHNIIGWKMIGVYECPVAVSDIQTIPPNCLNSPAYGYNNGYQIVDTLYPGYGYYIKGSCSVVIFPPCGIQSHMKIVKYIQDDWGKIVLTDAAGINYTLYAVKGQVDLSQYELPPAPMAGMFDIRFSSGRIAEDINSSMQTIDMSGVTYPLTVRVEGMDMRLMDETGKIVNVNLKSGEDVVISDPTINKLMVSGELIPVEYALEQNYPNPFNPSTVIEFSLPEDVGNVKLSIYNALGEKVAELVNTALTAGKYQYQWNAQNVATGMYIYELRTDKFVSVKKMVLIK